MDLTRALRGGGSVSRAFVVRTSSDSSHGVMYRSADGASPNGPLLTVKFAYDPNTNEALARSFGSDPPTPKPTVRPTTPRVGRREDARGSLPDVLQLQSAVELRAGTVAPRNARRVLRQAEEAEDERLEEQCEDRKRQSPRDMCRTNSECKEYREIRQRVSRATPPQNAVSAPLIFVARELILNVQIASVRVRRSAASTASRRATRPRPAPPPTSCTTSSASPTRSAGPSSRSPSRPAPTATVDLYEERYSDFVSKQAKRSYHQTSYTTKSSLPWHSRSPPRPRR